METCSTFPLLLLTTHVNKVVNVVSLVVIGAMKTVNMVPGWKATDVTVREGLTEEGAVTFKVWSRQLGKRKK